MWDRETETRSIMEPCHREALRTDEEYLGVMKRGGLGATDITTVAIVGVAEVQGLK